MDGTTADIYEQVEGGALTTGQMLIWAIVIVLVLALIAYAFTAWYASNSLMKGVTSLAKKLPENKPAEKPVDKPTTEQVQVPTPQPVTQAPVSQVASQSVPSQSAGSSVVTQATPTAGSAPVSGAQQPALPVTTTPIPRYCEGTDPSFNPENAAKRLKVLNNTLNYVSYQANRRAYPKFKSILMLADPALKQKLKIEVYDKYYILLNNAQLEYKKVKDEVWRIEDRLKNRLVKNPEFKAVFDKRGDAANRSFLSYNYRVTNSFVSRLINLDVSKLRSDAPSTFAGLTNRDIVFIQNNLRLLNDPLPYKLTYKTNMSEADVSKIEANLSKLNTLWAIREQLLLQYQDILNIYDIVAIQIINGWVSNNTSKQAGVKLAMDLYNDVLASVEANKKDNKVKVINPDTDFTQPQRVLYNQAFAAKQKGTPIFGARNGDVEGLALASAVRFTVLYDGAVGGACNDYTEYLRTTRFDDFDDKGVKSQRNYVDILNMFNDVLTQLNRYYNGCKISTDVGYVDVVKVIKEKFDVAVDLKNGVDIRACAF